LNLACAIEVVDGKKDLIPRQVRTQVDDLIDPALGTVRLQARANIIDDRCHVHETTIPRRNMEWPMIGERDGRKNA
jgi:hypothetical protein